MRCLKWVCFTLILAVGLCVSGRALAASSISDPLTSFDAANFTVFSADAGKAVTYDGAGAHFGTAAAGDAGRNYVRTIVDDYAFSSFVAEVTFDAGDGQAVFIGLGTGDAALFGTPDWSTQFSSASFWPETNNDKFTRFRTYNDQPGQFVGDTGVAGFDAGTHRFRMSYDAGTKLLVGEIDLNYAGGPFVADAVSSNFPIALSPLFSADGWPSEPSRIFFGGDDGAVFRDLSITVVPEPASLILFTCSIALCAVNWRKRTARNA